MHSIGGNCPLGSSQDRSTAKHSVNAPPPACLQMYGHRATGSSVILQVARNRSPVHGSLEAGEFLDPGAIVVQDAFGVAVGVAVNKISWKC